MTLIVVAIILLGLCRFRWRTGYGWYGGYHGFNPFMFHHHCGPGFHGGGCHGGFHHGGPCGPGGFGGHHHHW